MPLSTGGPGKSRPWAARKSRALGSLLKLLKGLVGGGRVGGSVSGCAGLAATLSFMASACRRKSLALPERDGVVVLV